MPVILQIYFLIIDIVSIGTFSAFIFIKTDYKNIDTTDIGLMAMTILILIPLMLCFLEILFNIFNQ